MQGNNPLENVRMAMCIWEKFQEYEDAGMIFVKIGPDRIYWDLMSYFLSVILSYFCIAWFSKRRRGHVGHGFFFEGMRMKNEDGSSMVERCRLTKRCCGIFGSL